MVLAGGLAAAVAFTHCAGRPLPEDIAADLIFYNGLFLEGQMSDTLKAKGAKSHALGDSVPAGRLKGEAPHPDPHIWGDASLWADVVPDAVEVLAGADPENASYYRERGGRVVARLMELHG